MNKLASLKGQIQNARSRIFRKCFIKRREQGTGLYEDEWVDITNDVVKWGNLKKEVDATKVNSFKFSTLNITLSNRFGSSIQSMMKTLCGTATEISSAL